MTLGTAIMFGVAAVLTLVGLGLLLSLTRPSGPAKVYVFRMAGIMLVSAGVVLAFSAWAMWEWSTASPVLPSALS